MSRVRRLGGEADGGVIDLKQQSKRSVFLKLFKIGFKIARTKAPLRSRDVALTGGCSNCWFTGCGTCFYPDCCGLNVSICQKN
ncbi:hypothetical protein KOW79_015651 [Hemibagrus wyckioides]|uniref:Uncharacterized protein n=1 Tax=Hemibagrus wyckioides TaxID=337641 RepID=A0A9D3ND55_9TELE|nr:hypothetical protein KOW79_015651 [Hemibagrus wyckioides]